MNCCTVDSKHDVLFFLVPLRWEVGKLATGCDEICSELVEANFLPIGNIVDHVVIAER